MMDASFGPHVPGILLEGGCFSGKSSVSSALVALLAARGLQACPGHCYVCSDEENARLHALALASLDERSGACFLDPDYFREFNRYRSLNLRHDTHLLLRRVWAPTTVQIQDRHWFSQYCQNDYFTPDNDWLPAAWRRECAPRFDLHAFLSCTDVARRSRSDAPARISEHGVHRHFRRFNAELADFEAHCRALWSRDADSIILDMDHMGPDQAAALICDAFLARSPYRHVEETSGV